MMPEERYQIEAWGLSSALWHVVDTKTGRIMDAAGLPFHQATLRAMELNREEAYRH